MYNSIFEVKNIYKVFINTLKLISLENPHRNSEKFSEGILEYENKFNGNIDDFF